MFKKYSIWIGLPAFNEEKAIKKVLESLIKLEKKIKTNIRVIIYNDGSSDKTVNNAKIYRNKINLKIIDNKINKGLGEAIYSLILYFKKKSKINDKLIFILESGDMTSTISIGEFITIDSFFVIMTLLAVPFKLNSSSLNPINL